MRAELSRGRGGEPERQCVLRHGHRKVANTRRNGDPNVVADLRARERGGCCYERRPRHRPTGTALQHRPGRAREGCAKRKPARVKSRRRGRQFVQYELNGHSEKTLIEGRTPQAVKETRSAFQTTMQDKFVSDVQRLS